ncbi:MBL fold metallo-hydrolase [Paenibacillus sp. MMS18-CY102]|uniref:MBL fold metallo-hydrolase n=1 Tax=Paenibacillus sp. MMS18-CY102 TaxID=2682849 RepID=UPI001365E655|nr:MBL fold metallo-hydrolase [Paenibacillus sp. MMS18-CY102]MWC31350.1 MBL fold metallo-hydrolase [Paenibacillus sp. MMS18-CY102]
MAKLNIQTFSLGPLQTNCYLLTDEAGERGIIIDPGMQPKRLLERIENIHIEAIVLTHAHFDHMGGVDEVRKAKGCPVYIHDLEADWLTNAQLNGSGRWKDVTPPLTTDPAEYALDEGQTLEFIGQRFSVMHTPGHSPGSVSLLCGNDLFSGDVLFRASVGRTDLPGGRERDLYDSIRLKLFKLPDDVTVYSGHGPKTTIGFEKANNPYVGLQR